MLLGLDLASRLSGWCAGDGRAVPLCGAWPLEPVHGDYGYLLDQLDGYLQAAITRFRPTRLAYEAPILVPRGHGGRQYGDKLSTLRLLYPMGAYVEFVCRRAGIECFEVTVSDIKSEVTGNAFAPKGRYRRRRAQVRPGAARWSRGRRRGGCVRRLAPAAARDRQASFGGMGSSRLDTARRIALNVLLRSPAATRGVHMTPKQSECLSYVREYIHQHEYSPSYEEIAARLGLASKSGVHRMLYCLVAEGHLTMRPNVSRSIQPVDRGRLTPESAAEALYKAHGRDFVIVCTPDEARDVLRRLLAS